MGVCASSAIVLCVLAVSSERHWQQRAAALERENLNLQLERLAAEVTQESNQLVDRARDIAESGIVAQLLQETAGTSPDRAPLMGLAGHSIDAIAVVSESQMPRFSATIDGDRMTEAPPAPAIVKFLESAAAVPRAAEDFAAHAPAATGIADDHWIVARPIMSRTSPSSILGWLAVTRSLSTPTTARLAQSMSGSLTAHALRGLDASGLPEGLLKAAASRNSQGFEVTTHLARDKSTGYAALRDAGGRTVWVFRLSLAQPDGGMGTGYVFAALSVLLALAVVAVLIFRRHLRDRNSVDARYKAIIDQANDGIVIVDKQTQELLYTNPAFLSRLGYTDAEAQALALGDIFADGTAPAETVLARLRDANSQLAMNMQQRCKNGSLIDIEVRCNELDVDGRDVLAYVTADVSLRRKAEQQLIENQNRLDRMAHHDQLTGLPNRHYLTAFLPQAIAEAQAASTMLGVVFLDLDRFKHINDTRGHETGDKLLQEVATRLRACVRDSDVVIRMGGDEFVVVFRNVKNYDEVTQVGARCMTPNYRLADLSVIIGKVAGSGRR